MNKLKFLLLAMFAVISCKDTEKDGFVKTTYYPNGAVASEISYLRDTIKHGAAKLFYENGQLSEEGMFKNGIKDGPYTAYYKDGALEERGNIHLGMPLGNFFYYYPNGQLELYNAQDYKREVFYVLKFDKSGNKIKEEGRVISSTISSPTYKEQYFVGDSMVLEYCIAEPPGYRASVVAGHYLQAGAGQKRLVGAFRPLPIISPLATYRLKFTEPGTYEIVCAGELLDTAKGFKLKDTSYTEITVH